MMLPFVSASHKGSDGVMTVGRRTMAPHASEKYPRTSYARWVWMSVVSVECKPYVSILCWRERAYHIVVMRCAFLHAVAGLHVRRKVK